MSAQASDHVIAGRFDVLTQLGAGGYGAVYEVIDRERNERLALKVLQRIDGPSLMRFKREFRAVADFHHPNLVTLRELLEVDGTWMFTMELLQGQTLDAAQGSGMFDPARGEAALRNLLDVARKLAQGLSALHAAGFVHRDVKPSNVMVTPRGRVVLLDFGLVIDETDASNSSGRMLGTPLYIAPECVRGLRASAASDWYSFGVLLYEIMNGAPPFEGQAVRVLLAKTGGPAPAMERAHLWPKELVHLSMRLLALDSSLRPSGGEVLRVLRQLEGKADAPRTEHVSGIWPANTQGAFVGRHAERAIFGAAVEQVSFGKTVAVYVSGESGIGKTTLVNEELARLRAQPDALILRGRCFERETLPYKALDGLMDELAQVLSADKALAKKLAVEGLECLLTLFRGLSAVESFANVRAQIPVDPRELRTRAFGALEALLRRLGEMRLLVLFVDDLQWADTESISVLSGIASAADSPALLLMLAGRPPEETPKGVAQALAKLLDNCPGAISLNLQPLEPEAARSLASSCLPEANAKELDQIVREAGGHPLFITEIARHAATPAHAPIVDLDSVLLGRIRALAARTRGILLCVALSPEGVSERVLSVAQGLSSADTSAALLELRGARLVKGATRDIAEIYHDRIRVSVTRSVDPKELTLASAALARAIEQVSPHENHVIALHYERAGLLTQAAQHNVRAAANALVHGAFERAVQLYASARRQSFTDTASTYVRASYALALTQIGRCADAAEEHLAVAQQTEDAEALRHLMKAAALLLQSGQFERGTELAKTLCKAEGIRWSESDLVVVLNFVYYGALSERRLRSEGRKRAHVDEREREVNEMLYGIGSALQNSDTLRGSALNAMLAARVIGRGDTLLELRAVSMLAISSSNEAPPFARSRRFLERARELSQLAQTPRAEGYYKNALAGAAFFRSEFAESLTAAEEAERAFHRHGAFSASELMMCQSFQMFGLIYAGRWKELPEKGRRFERDAFDRGDLFGQIAFPLLTYDFDYMLRDDPEGGQAHVTEAENRWLPPGFHSPHLYAMLSRMRLALYANQLDLAQEVFTRAWPRYHRSYFYRTYVTRGTFQHLELSIRLNRALNAKGTERAAWLRESKKKCQELHKVGRPFARVYENVGRAAIAHLSDRDLEAVPLLRDALALAREHSLGLLVPAVEMRLSQLVGGDEGRELRRAADAWTVEQGFRKVAGFYRLMVPGFEAP